MAGLIAAGAAQAGVAEDVLRYTNAARAEAGCGPLKLNARLGQAAQNHAEAMAEYDFFSHTGRDGSTPGKRATAAGYEWRGIAENIGGGYEDAALAVDGWMNSPGHRANILNCDYTELGVGYARGGMPLWVQVFGVSFATAAEPVAQPTPPVASGQIKSDVGNK